MKRIITGLGLLLYLFFNLHCTEKTSISGLDDQVAERLESFIRYQMEDKDLPAISIGIVDGTRPIWSSGFGFVDHENQERSSGDTVYRVASVSKLFTAISIMQLVEKGVLDLDAPITDYLPDFQPVNPFEKPITLRQLHSHRSGLVREPPVGHYFDPTEPATDSSALSLNRTTLVFEPETVTKYSNAAVAVAGLVIERTQHERYEHYIQRNVLDKIGMGKSSFLPLGDLIADLAAGYMWTYDGRIFDAPVFELGIGPAANLYTTVNDLCRFARVLFNEGQIVETGEQLLSSATLKEMWSVQYGSSDQQNGYGIGFYVSDFMGQRRVQHSGVMYGYATRLYVLPEADLGVAIVSTLDATNSVVDRIGNYALSLIRAQRLGHTLPPFTRYLPVDSTLARTLDGRYEGPGILYAVERNGRLYLDNGAERHRLMMAGDTLIVDDRLAYGLTLMARGDTLLTEQGTYVKRPIPVPAEPDPELTELIGEYGWDHNTLYILERENQLYVLIEWFFYYPLTQLDQDQYQFPPSGLYAGEKLTFVRDNNNYIIAVDVDNVRFLRRHTGSSVTTTESIQPTAPLAKLRERALAAVPPSVEGSSRQPELVELTDLNPSLKLDIRYASDNNFMGAVFYEEARAFLQRPAAVALIQVESDLNEMGLGLVVYDAYRPWHVTKMFWDATPAEAKHFVADPSSGSIHNRGAAVDVGLIDLQTGEVLPMPSSYDEFTARAYPDYPGGTARSRYYREILRDAMEARGFSVYRYEWWHFNFENWRAYPVMNTRFEEIGRLE